MSDTLRWLTFIFIILIVISAVVIALYHTNSLNTEARMLPEINTRWSIEKSLPWHPFDVTVIDARTGWVQFDDDTTDGQVYYMDVFDFKRYYKKVEE